MARVLVFGPCTIMGGGGMDTYILNCFSRMENIDIHIAKIYPNILYEKKYLDFGMKVIRFVNPRKNLFKSIYQIYKYIKYQNINVIYMNMGRAFLFFPLVPIIISKILKIKKVIIHAHSSSTNNLIRKIFHIVSRNWFILTSTRLACSDLAGKWFFKNNYIIINNAIDLNLFSFSSSERNIVRKKLNIENNYVIGYVGRMTMEKNTIFLLDTFYEAQKLNNMKLLLIGQGVMENKIRERCKVLNIEDKVIILKHRNDVSSLLQAMDYFLLPSFFEGFPMVLVEAQAAGLRCLVSDTVSRTVALTNLVEFKALNEGSFLWAKHICDNLTYERNISPIKTLTDKGFNIVDEARRVEAIILN